MTLVNALTAIEDAAVANASLRAVYEAGRVAASGYVERQEFIRREVVCDGIDEALRRAGNRAGELA